MKEFHKITVITGVLFTLAQMLFVLYSAGRYPAPFPAATVNASGLVLDLLFCAEFIIYFIYGHHDDGRINYFFRRAGWVSFVTSLPVLALNSVPLAGLAYDSNLPVCIRGIAELYGSINLYGIAFMLRLARVLRMAEFLNYSGSGMVRHHIVAASSAAVFGSLAVFTVFDAWTVRTHAGALETKTGEYRRLISAVKRISEAEGTEFREVMDSAAGSDPAIIRIVYPDGSINRPVNPLPAGHISRNGDLVVDTAECSLTVRTGRLPDENSVNSTRAFCVVLLMTLTFILVYGRYLLANTAGTLRVLLNGFRDPGYSLMARIRRIHGDDEVSELAEFYNDVYLPAKMRHPGVDLRDRDSALRIDDIMKDI